MTGQPGDAKIVVPGGSGFALARRMLTERDEAALDDILARFCPCRTEEASPPPTGREPRQQQPTQGASVVRAASPGDQRVGLALPQDTQWTAGTALTCWIP